MNSSITRRGFMVGCSSAIAAMAGARLSHVAFGSAEDEPNQDILVVLFLRGGLDGLNVVFPWEGTDRGIYEVQRSELAVPTSGENQGIRLNDRFGLHGSLAPLHELFQDDKLAIIHAAGLTSDTRSHFDAMQYMELGTPDQKSSNSGWLTRHLETSPNVPGQIVMPAASIGNLQPTSLLGNRESIGMRSPRDFSFGGNWRYGNDQRARMREMYQGDSWLHSAGVQTLDAIDVIEYAAPGEYTPANGAEYPRGGFGNSMKSIAQLIKMEVGMRVATVDFGGWDTHDYQGDEGDGYFASHLNEMGRGIHALYTDLSSHNGHDHGSRVTLVVMSEFGRSLKANGSRGTDHGHGNVMFVAGGNVNGGQIHGRWPGLTDLYDGRDLDITTDYRQVLSEILIRRLGNPNLGIIFPNYSDYAPLGVVRGSDLAPNYEAEPVDAVPPGSTLPPAQNPTPSPDPGETPVPVMPGDDTNSLFLPVVEG